MLMRESSGNPKWRQPCRQIAAAQFSQGLEDVFDRRIARDAAHQTSALTSTKKETSKARSPRDVAHISSVS